MRFTGYEIMGVSLEVRNIRGVFLETYDLCATMTGRMKVLDCGGFAHKATAALLLEQVIFLLVTRVQY